MDEVVNGIRFRRRCAGGRCPRLAEPGWATCERCRARVRQCHAKERLDRPEAARLRTTSYYARLRRDILTAYGGRCDWCGETDQEVLTLDHTHNDGAEERRSLGSGNSRLVLVMLRREGFPKGRHRVLCYNCNCGRDKSRDPSFEARRRALGQGRKGGPDGD